MKIYRYCTYYSYVRKGQNLIEKILVLQKNLKTAGKVQKIFNYKERRLLSRTSLALLDGLSVLTPVLKVSMIRLRKRTFLISSEL